MSTTADSTAFDKGTDPILKFFTIEQAREIVNFRGRHVQARIEELAAKSNEGELSAEELAEFEGYIKANKFIAILQAKVRKLLARLRIMDAKTRRQVRQRAGQKCEYCQLHQDQSPLAMLQIEHIIPKKHGGTDTEDNLAGLY